MSSGETTWLEDLEAAVKQAAQTIEALRGERDELARRAQELDARVGELEAKVGRGPGKGKKKGSGDKAAEAWRQERREIRKRVEKLTRRLEELLG